MKLFLAASAVFLVIASSPEAIAGGKGGTGGSVSVKGHVRKDGTYVPPHFRSAPDGNFSNNWSTQGNVNPYTGEEGKLLTPPSRSSAPSSYGYISPQGSVASPNPENLPDIYVPSYVPDGLTNSPSAAKPETVIPLPAPKQEVARGNSNFATQQKQRDWDRAQYWNGHGYKFDPALMSAYSMDQKVRDIQRAKHWQSLGYSFNPEFMTAYSMDQKVKDIERAKYWKQKGYSFNPDFQTAYSMDQKVRDIERSKYWQAKGYQFSPDFMTAYSMDQKVRDIERAKFWNERGLSFDPAYMTAYAMDLEAKRRGRAP